MPSSWSVFPTTENPTAKYKFTSLSLYVSADMEVTERDTYSLLEWLGDVGGLIDAMRYLGYIMITPITAFNMKIDLLTQIFSTYRLQRSDKRGMGSSSANLENAESASAS